MRNCIPSAVYVMLADNGHVKVGRSRDVANRARCLSWTGQHKVTVAFATAIREDGSYVEAVAHQLLAAKRVRGEWFAVSIADAVAAVTSAIAEVEARMAEPRLRRPRVGRRGRRGCRWFTVRVRLPLHLANYLDGEAARLGVSVSDVFVQILEKAVADAKI